MTDSEEKERGRRDKRDRLARFALYPTESLGNIVRRALVEWLADREALEENREFQNPEKSTETDKSDISVIENG